MSESVAPVAAPARKVIPISTWLTLGAFLLGIWPWFRNLSWVMDGGFAYYVQSFPTSIDFSNLGYLDYLLLPILEPLIMIAAVILAFVARNKVVRALPGFLYGSGFLIFFLLNVLSFSLPNDYSGNPWEWTVGPMPEGGVYVASVLLAVGSSGIALMEKQAKSALADFGTPVSAAATNRTPVAFDTNTGRPIYGYDTQTGQPIY